MEQLQRVSIGIGSNINREENIRKAVQYLTKFYQQINVSPVYESEALGFDGPPFFNLVVSFLTNDSLLTLQEHCKEIEQQFGKPSETEKFCSRTLDLDVLLYADLVQPAKSNGEPELPRSEVLTSAFVLKPLADLHPLHVHPVEKETLQNLWQQFSHSEAGQRQALNTVAFRW